jgi:hypothetical protein
MRLFKLFQKKWRERIFTKIYRTNYWAAKETVSGPGSTLEYTHELRQQLPKVIEDFKIKSILDIPCGDFHWMNHVDLKGASYTGGDIVNALVESNKKKFPQHIFIQVDIVYDNLPSADLLLNRDCFIHLSNQDILSALGNIKQSGIPLLLTNTYPDIQNNIEIKSGDYRMINLSLPPFNFPAPILLLKDYVDGFPERYLGLWKTSDLL